MNSSSSPVQIVQLNGPKPLNDMIERKIFKDLMQGWDDERKARVAAKTAALDEALDSSADPKSSASMPDDPTGETCH